MCQVYKNLDIRGGRHTARRFSGRLLCPPGDKARERHEAGGQPEQALEVSGEVWRVEHAHQRLAELERLVADRVLQQRWDGGAERPPILRHGLWKEGCRKCVGEIALIWQGEICRMEARLGPA